MTETTLSGRCLCGTVKYDVSGTPLRFLHCHCERCRRASGTGHATNILFKPGTVDWRGTEGHVKRFKLPEAERFGTAFCTTCGGPLPRVGADLVVVPAGSLESVPEIVPQGRIFWDSRATWSCAGNDLPSYAEYPTG
jgi:hypothetical protein